MCGKLWVRLFRCRGLLEIKLVMLELHIKDGWHLNPNEKTVRAILRGVERCNGECQCHNTGRDKVCLRSDYREEDICHCHLYIKDEE